MATTDGRDVKPKAAQVLIGDNALIVKERSQKRIHDPYAKLPEMWSAGRAIISVADATIAFVQNASWSVSTEMEEIRTVDSQLPWELAVGQTKIRASLSQFIDPANSPESQMLFANMQSSLHQPMVFIEFFDKLGTKLFTAKGMFESVNGSVSQGGLGTLSASFVGIAFTHNTVGSFTPYPDSKDLLGRVSSALGNFKKVGF